jgi:hypothetical protein
MTIRAMCFLKIPTLLSRAADFQTEAVFGSVFSAI